MKKEAIKEGYFGDIVIVDDNNPWTVSKDNVLYKCKWSPFEGTTFKSRVTHTLVNGQLVYENSNFYEVNAAKRLTFSR